MTQINPFRLLNAFFMALVLTSCSTNKLSFDTITYPIGNEDVEIRRLQSKAKVEVQPSNHVIFYNMHENENTSVKAIKRFFRDQSGTLFYLHQRKQRNIRFTLNQETYRFDPNRIYTDEGIRKTLLRHGNFSKEAYLEVKEFANYLLQLLNAQHADTYIALHNNGELEYSLSSYLPDGRYATDALRVNENEMHDVDDFFFTTDAELFDDLAGEDWNVILQDNKQGSDDGSLSIYAGQLGIRYVNIEAQHGHKATQFNMIEALMKMLDAKKSPTL